ncbi:putative RTM1-like protein [Tuber borchii]|uniref:Putative RTM1-like protein n=1 Tax=Tuber borchii TaxID=42251 RepID=A0A2T7A358_TUBBO|nr:putative RTM1-like protein [Tuber borchii]
MAVKFEYYHYTPSLIGASIFAALFFLSAGCHVIQLTRAKTWYFIPLVVGALMEGGGYVARAISHHDRWVLMPYLIQSLLLLIAPAVYAASIYMILGRLITTIEADHHSMIRPTWLTKIFVAGDVLSFLMQSTGGGMLAKQDKNSAKLGENIILGGLFVQILFFGFFMVATVVFHLRLRKNPTQASQMSTKWRTLLMALYVASLFIMVRSVFRVVEYKQGRGGYLMGREVWLYIFDGVLMFCVTVLFNVVHPSIAVPGRRGKVAEDGYAMGSRESS